jgi:hypothetical protein
MKRILIAIFSIAVLGSLSLSTTFAIDKSTLSSIADQLPEDTEVVIAISTDQGTVDSLNGLINLVGEKLPEGILPLELPIDLTTQIPNYDLGRSILGDWVVISSTDIAALNSVSGDELPEGAMITVQLADPETLQALIPNDVEPVEADVYTIYTVDGVSLAFEGDWLYIVAEGGDLPAPGAENLNSNEEFAIVNQLPADAYGVYMWANLDAINEMNPQVAAINEGMSFGYFAIGMGLADGNTLWVDVVQENLLGITYAPVDLGGLFSRVPANAQFAIATANIGEAIETTLDTLETTQPGIRQQLEDGFAQGGLNLETDLLDWANGDFVGYFNIDFNSLMDSANNRSLDSNPVELGWMFQTTNAEASDGLVTKLNAMVTAAAANDSSDNVPAIADATIGTLDGFTLTIPPQNNLPEVVLFMGSDDEIVFIGTQSAAETISNPDGSVTGDAVFQASSAYFLDGAGQVMYASGEGITSLVGGVLLVTTNGNDSGMEQVEMITGLVSDLVDHATATIISTEDHLISRATITLK